MTLIIGLSDLMLVVGLTAAWLALSMASVVLMIKSWRWLKNVWKERE